MVAALASSGLASADSAAAATITRANVREAVIEKFLLKVFTRRHADGGRRVPALDPAEYRATGVPEANTHLFSMGYRQGPGLDGARVLSMPGREIESVADSGQQWLADATNLAIPRPYSVAMTR